MKKLLLILLVTIGFGIHYFLPKPEDDFIGVLKTQLKYHCVPKETLEKHFIALGYIRDGKWYNALGNIQYEGEL